MTFASTYLSRKQLLVDKLVSKGVTGYTSSDGLTTLINAVDEIKGGATKTLTLICDKTTLSQYNSDTATLTAILLDGGTGVSGEEITFNIGSAISPIIKTNSQGVAQTTYTSQGVGDITLSATVDDLSSTVKIEDCIFFSGNEYECTSSTGNYITIADLSETQFPPKFELSADYKSNGESRFGFFNKQSFSGNPDYSVFIGSPDGSRWYYGSRSTSTDSTDINEDITSYHTYIIKRDGETYTYKRDEGPTYSKSIIWFDAFYFIIGAMNWSGTSFVKNIKLKAL